MSKKSLFVNVSHTLLDSYYSGEEFGEWSEDYDVDLLDCGLEQYNKSSYCHEEPLTFDVNIGDTVYVLWAVWSSGDSFGRDSKGSYEIISVFKTLEMAQQAFKVLDELPEENKFDNRVKITLEDGTIMEYYRPWLGYFDYLDELKIDECIVQEKI